MNSNIEHANVNSIHKFAYVQSNDPGAIGAKKGWVDTSVSPYILKVRNNDNTGWDEVGSNLAPDSGGDLTTLSDYDGTLSGAVNSIGANKVILSINEPVTLSANLNIPSNIQLDPRATINISGGATLTINSMSDPGDIQIFTGAGTVVFGNGAIESVRTSWWSGITPGNITSALSSAVTSISTYGGTVLIPQGVWTGSFNQTITTGITIEGALRLSLLNYGTELRLTSPNNPIFRIGSLTQNVTFRNLVLNCNNQLNSTGVLAEGSAAGGPAKNIRFETVTIQSGTYGYRINSTGSDWQVAQTLIDGNCEFILNDTGIRCNTPNMGLDCSANFYLGANQKALHFSACGLATFRHCEFGYAGAAGYGANQMVSQVVVSPGGITTSGFGQSVVTAAGMTGSPALVYVPLNTTEHTSATLIARAFRHALSQNPSVASFFHVGGIGTSIELFPIDRSANDATMNFTIEDLTSVGITDDLVAVQDFAGSADTSLGECVLHVDGQYGAISFLACQDEGISSALIHDTVVGVGNISYVNCLLQGRLDLNTTANISISGGVSYPKLVRDSASGSASVVEANNTVVFPNVYLAGSFREVERRLTNFGGATANSSVSKETINRDFGLYGIPYSSSGIPTKYYQNDVFFSHPTTEAWVEILSNRTDKHLLRLGRGNGAGLADYYYDFWRKTSDGRLQLEGNQTNFVGLDFNGDFTGYNFIGTSVTPTQITSNQNNYSPLTYDQNMRLSSDASRNITGFSLLQKAGQSNYIFNIGSNNIVLKHENASSLAANRILSSTGSDIVMLPNDIVAIYYDGVISRWRGAKITSEYTGLLQNSKSADYTTVIADAGKHILHPSADTTPRTFTIDSNANVAYPIGTEITFVNQDSAGSLSIAITSDTMRLAGAGTTGTRTLAANGIAKALKITATEWLISGTNLT